MKEIADNLNKICKEAGVCGGVGNPDGYVFVVGDCYTCGGMFTFNPVRVPSFRDKSGVKQPVCRACMEYINAKRKEMGLEPFIIPADAYEPVSEEEL